MAYTIKPSVGMLPIDDLDKAMLAQGFIKEIDAADIQDITAEKDPTTNTVKTPGITDPSRIAICAGERNENGTLDRETVKNALNLNGVPAENYLQDEDMQEMNNNVNLISQAYANEIQLLRDELYHLKEELVRTGHISDTFVADGFIDGFKNNNIKYSELTSLIESINGAVLTQSDNIFDKEDWLIIANKLAGATDDINMSYELAEVINEQGNNIELTSDGYISTTENETVLQKSLGEYNCGTFSFSHVESEAPGKTRLTMLNDDTKIVKNKIESMNAGFMATVKIPERCAGYLTSVTIYGKTVGNPGALTCYMIKNPDIYINDSNLTSEEILEKAEINMDIIKDTTVCKIDGDEITFDFTNTSFNAGDKLNTLYPEIEAKPHLIVVKCNQAFSSDSWTIDFGSKKSEGTGGFDLQTNNYSYSFTNNSVLKLLNEDMLYVVATKDIEDEKEIPFSVGLYTTAKAIKLNNPIQATRARVTLEINKEGNLMSSNATGVCNAVQMQYAGEGDVIAPSRVVFKAGDKVIIGNEIASVTGSTLDKVTLDRDIYLSETSPIYRCGYEIQLRTYVKEKNEDGIPVTDLGTLKVHPLNLVAVISNGRPIDNSVSDRLIFETDIDPKDAILFNEAELQIKWKSALTDTAIEEEAKNGRDYVGRIHSLSLAFDKVINN